MTAQPSPAPEVLHDIASASWEHPADRAALETLKSIPGLDQLIKKMVGFVGERGVRALFQANAIRVGPTQLPELHRLLSEVQATLDWHEDVPLFVSQHPMFNAGAYGVDRPFIVVNSAALDHLEEPELRVLLGHELGHIMSGHALYNTLLILILNFGLQRLPLLAGFAVAPIRFALLEWSRRSELSCDRAGLLVSRDPDDSLRLLLKSAGGTLTGRYPLNLDAYKQQVADYELLDGVDGAFKLFNLMSASHPFHTVRAAELMRWAAGAEHSAIRAGDYRRRSGKEGAPQPVAALGSAAGYYVDRAKQGAIDATQSTRDMGQQASSYAKQLVSSARGAAQLTAESLGTRLREARARKRARGR